MATRSTPTAPGEAETYQELCAEIARERYCHLSAAQTKNVLELGSLDALQDWKEFQASWNNMAKDTYMADGGQYRRRRHAVLAARPAARTFEIAEPRPVYQDLEFNPLNGGVFRRYDPVEDHVLHGCTMQNVVRLGCTLFGRLAPTVAWNIDVHQFRIEAVDGGYGRPSPEGVHRDGVKYVIMMLVHRENVIGGESTLYDVDRNPIRRCTLTDPMEILLVDDERVLHGVDPISPQDRSRLAVRDVLVITYGEDT